MVDLWRVIKQYIFSYDFNHIVLMIEHFPFTTDISTCVMSAVTAGSSCRALGYMQTSLSHFTQAKCIIKMTGLSHMIMLRRYNL